MKVYEIIIQPVTGFGTPLKGDTLFGHLCWQVAYDETILGQSLGDLLSVYPEMPFAVLSSACLTSAGDGTRRYAVPAPALPMDWLFNLPADKKEKIRKRKDYKKKVWMLLQRDTKAPPFKEMGFLDDGELALEMKGPGPAVPDSRMHNRINRLTNRTGEGFAPYSVDLRVYPPGTELALFAGVDPDLVPIEAVMRCLERIGDTGFGKDASTGLGRFKPVGYDEIDLAAMGSDTPNACYTLAPCVPQKDTFSRIFFSPFTRFGRHGDVLAKSSNPFKNPVIMANEGAVMVPRDIAQVLKAPHVGTAVTGVSKSEEKAVTQGYSLYVPVRLEADNG